MLLWICDYWQTEAATSAETAFWLPLHASWSATRVTRRLQPPILVSVNHSTHLENVPSDERQIRVLSPKVWIHLQISQTWHNPWDLVFLRQIVLIEPWVWSGKNWELVFQTHFPFVACKGNCTFIQVWPGQPRQAPFHLLLTFSFEISLSCNWTQGFLRQISERGKLQLSTVLQQATFFSIELFALKTWHYCTKW